MKKRVVFVIIALVGWTGIAMADGHSDRVSDLEKDLAKVSAEMKSIQTEIAALKGPGDGTSKPTAVAEEAPGGWAERVTLNGRVRVRGYRLDNLWDFNDDEDTDRWSVFRIYGSLKATANIRDDVTAVVNIANQNYGNGVTNAKTWEEDNKSNKFFLDNAYINIRNIFGYPMDLRVGRQNMTYGSGFVIFDGNSQLGSTSQYFDGVKLSWHISPDLLLDAFYMSDEENNRDNESDDDIHLSGVYFTASKTPVFGKLELYMLNRNDETLNKDIWVLGGRISNKMENGFDYSLDAATQTGEATTDVDQEAWGAKTEAGYTFTSSAATPRVYAGLAYLSGDDPATEENEGWDVIYGGWPQFGDLLGWIYVNVGAGNALSGVYDYNRMSSTGGESVFSNLRIATLGGSFKPMENVTVSASYSNMAFNETYPGIDNDFGDYFQTVLKYQYNKQLSFRVYGNLLSPGDAFSATEMDNASELFWEMDFKF